MPRGGWRGGGRPTKAAQLEKERLLNEAIAAGPKILPRVLLQGIMDSPGSTRMEKLKACELYMKLPPEAAPRVPAEPSLQMSIISIPREVFLTNEQIDNIEKLAEQHGVPLEPFEPTASVSAEAASSRDLERLDVPDDNKIARLHPVYGRTFSNGRRLAAGPRDLPDDDTAA
jgi:hypothetical protein